MQRIAIVGISGAGKSHYARALQARARLPLHHMDGLFWRGEWEAVPESDYVVAQRHLLLQDAWIIEGYIDPALAERARVADLIIDLDLPGLLCAWRVVRRWRRRAARAELPPQALERLTLGFLWMVLRRAERRAIEESLRGVDPAKVVRVRSPSQLKQLTDSIVGPSIA